MILPRLVTLISGNGSNLQAILDACDELDRLIAEIAKATKAVLGKITFFFSFIFDKINHLLESPNTRLKFINSICA